MKILIAEDNAVDAVILRNILEHEGHAAVVVDNGVAALQALEANPDIALVFADVRMPELDGLGLFAGMRERPELASIPLVFVSAVAEAEAVKRALDMGSDGYLLKPVHDRRRVVDLLRRALVRTAEVIEDPRARLRREGFAATAMLALRQQLALDAAAALESGDGSYGDATARMESLGRLSAALGATRLLHALRAVANGEDGADARLHRELRAVVTVLNGPTVELTGQEASGA